MLKVVNFGSGRGGLSTVGYTIYGLNGTVASVRTTAGIFEVGTNTGIYAGNVNLPEYECVLLWDTGEATPRYSTEDYQNQINSIENSMGAIDKIYNSIKNQGEFMATLMNKLGLLEKNQDFKNIDGKITKLSERENVSLTNIEDAFNKAAGKIKFTSVSPEIKIPEVKIPDYSPVLSKLQADFEALSAKVSKIPIEAPKMPEIKDYSVSLEALRKEIAGVNSKVNAIPAQKEYKPNFDNMISMLNSMQSSLARNFDEKSKELREQLLKIQSIFTRFDELLNKINELGKSISTLDVNDKEMIKAKKGISEEIKVLQKMLDPVYQSRQLDRKYVLMTYGNRLKNG